MLLSDSDYPARPLKLDFSRGDIPWDDFREMLDTRVLMYPGSLPSWSLVGFYN